MPLIETAEKLAVNFHRRKFDALTMVSTFLFQQKKKRPLLSKYLWYLEDPTGLKSSCLEDSDTKPENILFSW